MDGHVCTEGPRQSCSVSKETTDVTVKGQIISECSYEIIVYPKIATKKNSEISALASKERSNQKLY